MSDLLIDVRDVSLAYHMEPGLQLLKNVLGKRLLGRDPAQHMVQALDSVSLELRRKETVGVIGRNGAGKTTLMRVIAGTLEPDRGVVKRNARVSALLALGIGFRRQLSARRNIELAGLAAGYTSKEVKSLEMEILEFADLAHVADWPLKSFSSGMVTRLGFAVSTTLVPEVLIIDEALSAGDLAFREKAASRMKLLRSDASALVLVSHSMRMISEFCDRAVWLDQGCVRMEGPTHGVLQAYEKSIANAFGSEAKS